MFLGILATMLSGINNILMYKSFYNSTWPTTSTFHGFYDMEGGSIDVLFLGSSHCVSAFSPQEIYDGYGLRTYNLGSEQQNLLVSYHWLREALRTQSPKAVVLETYICFDYRRAFISPSCSTCEQLTSRFSASAAIQAGRETSLRTDRVSVAAR